MRRLGSVAIITLLFLNANAFNIQFSTLQSRTFRPLTSQRPFRLLKCSLENELVVGVAEDVQHVGRGTLLSRDDAVKEVSSKVKGLYDAYPYPPEAVFDGPTVGYNHRCTLQIQGSLYYFLLFEMN